MNYRLIAVCLCAAPLCLAGCHATKGKWDFDSHQKASASKARFLNSSTGGQENLRIAAKPSEIGSPGDAPSASSVTASSNIYPPPIIRGQSPSPSSIMLPQSSPGSGDQYRGPMIPSGQPLSEPRWPTINSGASTWNNATPPGNQPTTGFGQTLTPNTVYQNPTPGAMPYGQPIPLTPSQMAGIDPPAEFQPIPGNSSTLNLPWDADPNLNMQQPLVPRYNPRVRDVPVDVYVEEGRTGSVVFGGSVNSDLGVAGNIILQERNFDLFRLPTRGGDWFTRGFRGGGQDFRMELVPGNQVQRYTFNLTQPNLFGYSPWSLSTGGFLFTRFYRDWNEQRLGGRVALGYAVGPDLSLSTEIRGESVKIYNPRVVGLPKLDSVVGNNELYTARVRLAHNTRDNNFLPTEGHLLEFIYDQVFGDFDFPRGQVNLSRYFLLREREGDQGGRHTLTTSWKLGFSGKETPVFENYFAGGYTTMRGFAFRGASPKEMDVQVGGRFMFLGTVEYMFPLTADDMIRSVVFVDYGTIEQNIEIQSENFRVAPGFGFRIAVPALGPAPLAFDFSFPVNKADTDVTQVFSFNVGLTR